MTTTDEFVENGTKSGTADQKPLTSILDAPDYSEFVKAPKSAKAKQYERKTASMLKTGMVASIQVGNLKDAATIIHYGPSFAAAAGEFAASNEKAASMVDMICSPSNPALTFMLAGIPLLGQFMRNHEAELADIPEKRRTFKARKAERKAATANAPAAVQFRIPILGKTISLRMKLRARLLSSVLTGFRRGTQDPDDLAMKVFTDEKVTTALRKQGFDIRTTAPEE